MYNDCQKKGFIARTAGNQQPWDTTNYKIVFSKNGKYYWSPKYTEETDHKYNRVISPEYGYEKYIYVIYIAFF